jgi:hypothetical protein
MFFRLQVTRMIGFCLAGGAGLAGGAFLALAVQPRIQATMQAPTSSENAVGDNRKQVAEKLRSIEIPMINYYARGGGGKVEFSPTALMPSAKGEGRVKILKEGSVSVEAQFTGLESATKFSNEFLTYVLWGSVPQGQTLKIGELALKGNRGQVVATTVLRTFAMLVTAEPYAAVTQPSSIVVLKGVLPASDTTQTASAQIELLGDPYAPPGYNYEPLNTVSGYAPALIQAMNARRIAQVLQAEKYASQKFQAAEDLYQYMIGSAIQGKQASKQLLGVAKAVAQSYEEARAVSIRQQTLQKQ